MDKDIYKAELYPLQVNLVAMQRQLIAENRKLLVILEGRDAAGKDGVIKRVVQHQSPRETRVVALGKPSERDRSSWYFQRWVNHLPANGEMVLFNRSWYNRAGVERVMGFCEETDYVRFLRDVGPFEKLLIDDGMIVLKYYLDLSRGEQARRLEARKSDPLKTWKISPIDAVALKKFDAYTEARDAMLAATGEAVPWRVVKADDKRVARLAVIADILAAIPCADYPYPITPARKDVLRVWSNGDRPDDFLEH
ncbi:polyphosphate kinase 2 [Oceanicaulis sp. MMSF_3324]|uniref:polyphosphate kinase 2 n=1 Tax=Oceanicaulis sp. MMSF_3324 TaxID=3046702 RepID=UPI00273FA03D|nr:polyphosphate kinase 2 [Oceanicaulis sp. MMSF_3324]